MGDGDTGSTAVGLGGDWNHWATRVRRAANMGDELKEQVAGLRRVSFGALYIISAEYSRCVHCSVVPFSSRKSMMNCSLLSLIMVMTWSNSMFI